MVRKLAWISLAAAFVLAGCGGGGGGGSSPAPVPTQTVAPTPTPAPTAPALPLAIVSAPFIPTPYPQPVTQINFPATGAASAVTLQASGGTAPYSAQTTPGCGFGGNGNVTVSKIGTNQFQIVPTTNGPFCYVTFSDSATPALTALVLMQVNVNGSSVSSVQRRSAVTLNR